MIDDLRGSLSRVDEDELQDEEPGSEEDEYFDSDKDETGITEDDLALIGSMGRRSRSL